jgi:2-haloacid dehalogenase
MEGIDFDRVEVLTFDCYGTLIDWEQGILTAARRLIGDVGDDEHILEQYARHEAATEAGPWRPYRDVLAHSLAAVCAELGVPVTPAQRQQLGNSVAEWPAFPDSADALDRLRQRFDLGVITNCDDSLFAYSNDRLGRPFRWIVTAEQVRAYKPNHRNFEVALERIGKPQEHIVHVAQSLYHDHVPARELGLRTIWVNRRHGRPGPGATPPTTAYPDLEVANMASLADIAVGN